MDSEEQLEKFRLQWKSELNTKKENQNSKSSKNRPEAKPGPSDSLQKESKFSYFEDVSDEQNQEDKQESDVDQSNNMMNYYPFHIVQNLLFRGENKNRAELESLPAQSQTFKKNKNISVDGDSLKRNLVDTKVNVKSKKRKTLTLKDIFSERLNKELPDEKLLEKLIADIDEITEIPFFDTSLPREVAVKIFQYLDIVDLCQCAQVSKSWRSLAEDELLWCRLCHRLGHENIYTTREKENWKQIVQHNVERQRTLVLNWKNRIGKLSPLEHVKGRILCTVHSHSTKVVAGYTNGEVKLWDVSEEDSCVFQPSNTSLLLDVNDDDGLHENIVSNVMTSDDITVASYSQGNVDIWSLENGTQPIQTVSPLVGNQGPSNICLSEDGTCLTISYGPYFDILHKAKNGEEFEFIKHYDSENMVRQTKLYNYDCDISPVIFANRFSVHMYRPVKQETNYVDHVTELHNIIGAPVEVFDFKTDQSVLGVGLGSYGAMADGFRVKLYDIKTASLLQTLQGHTWLITCLNMQESPENELITGSGDRKLRIFDMRSCRPVQTLIGHASKVLCVQMDELKVVSGDDDGFLCVWDRRMATKLWDLHNRHPVKYCHYNDKTLIVANVSPQKSPEVCEFDGMAHRRYRGSLNVYNFLEDLTTKDIPEICLSTYDQPDASKYNIGLTVPYDTLQY